MKKNFTSILFLFVIQFTNAQDFKSPMEYLDYIGKESALISQSTWKYTMAVAHSKSARKTDNTRKKLVKTIQESAKKIQGLTNGYKGDLEYRDQLLTYFKISENRINEEYDKIIDMQEVADQSYDFMEAYIMSRDLVNKKINQEIDKLNANQKLFANKYNINISDEKSELEKKMDISDEVFENHTQLYLIFFKVNITEANLMKALAEKNLNAIQQNSSALELYSQEGLDKLKTFKAYKNDTMLVNATKKALEFTKKEAIDFCPKVISFMMLSQKVEDAKKTFDNKSSKDRTEEEVNAFNKLVDEMNKEVGKYNQINDKFNNERSSSIDNWNQTGSDFISKHVPEN